MTLVIPLSKAEKQPILSKIHSELVEIQLRTSLEHTIMQLIGSNRIPSVVQ